MQAIVSDIRANLTALKAVLADLAQFPISAIRCLGDTVGYGPHPRECLDLARDFDTILRGDTDDLIDPSSSHEGGASTSSTDEMIRWTQAELNKPSESSIDALQRRTFLRALKPSHSDGAVLFVHGSPRNPLSGYLFPEDVYNTRKLTKEFSQLQGLCFCGHTQLPGYFARSRIDQSFEFFALEGDEITFRFDGEPLICNVGSVGQPRDGDPRASYALFDNGVIRLRRVASD